VRVSEQSRNWVSLVERTHDLLLVAQGVLENEHLLVELNCQLLELVEVSSIIVHLEAILLPGREDQVELVHELS